MIQIHKINHWLAFYKGTIKISLFVSIGVAVVTLMGGYPISNSVTLLFQTYPTFGLACDAAYRFSLRRSEFYFYHNASCSVIELYSVAFLISAVISSVAINLLKLI